MSDNQNDFPSLLPFPSRVLLALIETDMLLDLAGVPPGLADEILDRLIETVVLISEEQDYLRKRIKAWKA